MKTPFISVIIPIYNTRNEFPRCVESVLMQTFENIEIIVVDDGSTDGSGELCDEYAKKDVRIKVIHQNNHGLVYSRKAGLKKAMGEYIVFVDSDDYVDTDMLDRLVCEIGEERPDVIAFGCVEEFGYSKRKALNELKPGYYRSDDIRKYILPNMLSLDFYKTGLLPSLCTKMFRLDLYKRAGAIVNDRVKYGEDADLVFQMFAYADSVMIKEFTPYHYMRRERSMVSEPVSLELLAFLYSDLKDSFLRADIWDFMESKLDDYITVATLLKRPDVILEDIIKKSSKIALYGAGVFGQAMYGMYGEQVTLWVDGNSDKYRDFPYKIYDRQALFDKRDEYEEIFIAILNEETSRNIKENLINQGIDCKIHLFSQDMKRKLF